MTGEQSQRGLVDTNILILHEWLNSAELPTYMAISAVALAELSAGPDLVQAVGEEGIRERSGRMKVPQWAQAEFEPIPFGADAARAYAQIAAGPSPRRRVADLFIAATAMAEGLPLFTTNPDDFDRGHLGRSWSDTPGTGDDLVSDLSHPPAARWGLASY